MGMGMEGLELVTTLAPPTFDFGQNEHGSTGFFRRSRRSRPRTARSSRAQTECNKVWKISTWAYFWTLKAWRNAFLFFLGGKWDPFTKHTGVFCATIWLHIFAPFCWRRRTTRREKNGDGWMMNFATITRTPCLFSIVFPCCIFLIIVQRDKNSFFCSSNPRTSYGTWGHFCFVPILFY